MNIQITKKIIAAFLILSPLQVFAASPANGSNDVERIAVINKLQPASTTFYLWIMYDQGRGGFSNAFFNDGKEHNAILPQPDIKVSGFWLFKCIDGGCAPVNVTLPNFASSGCGITLQNGITYTIEGDVTPTGMGPGPKMQEDYTINNLHCSISSGSQAMR